MVGRNGETVVMQRTLSAEQMRAMSFDAIRRYFEPSPFETAIEEAKRHLNAIERHYAAKGGAR